nr:hypothetical protein [uncultured Mediterranean phage uvMED]
MRRPDPMIPGKPGAQDVPAMRNRQAWIEALYKYEGRDDKNHPMHGLYTGLMNKHFNTMSIDG